MMQARHLAVAFGAVLGLAAAGCKDDPNHGGLDAGTDAGVPSLATEPIEWVGFHTEVPFAPGDFHALASGLFGPDAQAGKFISRDLAKGLTVASIAESATPAQSRVSFTFDDGGAPRVLAVAPASFEVGTIFVKTIDAALAKMQADEAASPGSGESFFLEYRVASPMGGTLSFGVRAGAGVYTLVIDIASPHTSLIVGSVGTAADRVSTPVDSVAGTVNFHLSKDQFDYFVDHAYGKGATGAQNFSDFALIPHTWLRLTVTPQLTDQLINVGFQVLLADKSRLDFAKAPASILAGDTFRALVDRNMETSLIQEGATKGSATPWTVPFFYNQPTSGGVVQVVASGTQGIFAIAYAVESPRHTLVDVPFQEYKNISILPSPDPTCDKLGDPTIALATQGVFDVTFTVSMVISNNPMGALQGTLYCSVYHASDVDVSGPKADAISVQDFTVPNATLGATPAPTFTTQTLLDGDYQLLCFQDRLGTGNVAKHDPVTLPIGSFPIACNKNPITVEFGLLDPQD